MAFCGDVARHNLISHDAHQGSMLEVQRPVLVLSLEWFTHPCNANPIAHAVLALASRHELLPPLDRSTGKPDMATLLLKSRSRNLHFRIVHKVCILRKGVGGEAFSAPLQRPEDKMHVGSGSESCIEYFRGAAGDMNYTTQIIQYRGRQTIQV